MSAGLPAADPRVWVEGQTFRQGDLGIVHPLREVEVVEARRGLHQHRHGDRMRPLPAVGEADLGRQLADRGFEIEYFSAPQWREGRG